MIISFGTGKVETTGGGGSAGILQQKKITITENGLDVVVPDAGYDGLSTVYVKTYVTDATGKKDFSVLGYDDEVNTQLNEEIDADIAYSKDLLNQWNSGSIKRFADKTELVYAPAVDTSKTTTADSFFKNCPNLKVIPYYDWSSCNTFNAMFSGWGANNTVLDLTHWDVSNVSTFTSLFSDNNAVIKLNLTGWDISKSKSLRYAFSYCANLKEIEGLDTWSTSNITDMGDMFRDCSSLTDLDLSSWDVSEVTNLTATFQNVTKLNNLNLSNWKLNSWTGPNSSSAFLKDAGTTTGTLLFRNAEMPLVTDVTYLFYGSRFNVIDLTGTVLPSIGKYNELFKGISSLGKVIGLKIPPSVYSIDGMFRNCTALTELDMEIDFSKISIMKALFQYCSSLTTIPTISLVKVGNLPFSNSLSNASSIFSSCSKLKTFGGFTDCENITSWGGTSSYAPFYDTTNLENITGFGTIKNDAPNMSKCTKLTVDSLMVLINALYDYVGNAETPSGTVSLTIGSTNLAKLTDEQKAIATAKGWLLK